MALRDKLMEQYISFGNVVRVTSAALCDSGTELLRWIYIPGDNWEKGSSPIAIKDDWMIRKL